MQRHLRAGLRKLTSGSLGSLQLSLQGVGTIACLRLASGQAVALLCTLRNFGLQRCPLIIPGFARLTQLCANLGSPCLCFLRCVHCLQNKSCDWPVFG